jgi:hypothetical protein
MQEFYEKLEEKKDWKQMLTQAEELIEEVIPELDSWEPWG